MREPWRCQLARLLAQSMGGLFVRGVLAVRGCEKGRSCACLFPLASFVRFYTSRFEVYLAACILVALSGPATLIHRTRE